MKSVLVNQALYPLWNLRRRVASGKSFKGSFTSDNDALFSLYIWIFYFFTYSPSVAANQLLTYYKSLLQ